MKDDNVTHGPTCYTCHWCAAWVGFPPGTPYGKMIGVQTLYSCLEPHKMYWEHRGAEAVTLDYTCPRWSPQHVMRHGPQTGGEFGGPYSFEGERRAFWSASKYGRQDCRKAGMRA